MRRWIFRMMCAAVLGGTVPAGYSADNKSVAPPYAGDPYRAATPFNATVMNRTAPNPANNMPNFTLSCDIPNMNTEGYVVPACLWGCGGGGCGHGCGSILGGCNSGCGNSCDSGCGGSLFSRFGGCGTTCSSGCGSSCGSILSRPSFGGCGSSCNSCDSGCGSGGLFSRFSFGGCGNSCNSQPSCNTCNTCDTGCGSGGLFSRFNFGSSCGSSHNSCNTCDSGYRSGGLFSRFGGCGDSCGRDRWARWSVGCNSGCSSPCSTGCGTTGGCAPAAVTPAAPVTAPKPMPKADTKPMSFIEPIGFWTWEKKDKSNLPVNSCDSCPPNGPKPKHTSKSPTTLGCASCSTWESEQVFLFGTCRQFFGEPTHAWLHGKTR